jgi:hypothetical protein
MIERTDLSSGCGSEWRSGDVALRPALAVRTPMMTAELDSGVWVFSFRVYSADRRHLASQQWR